MEVAAAFLAFAGARFETAAVLDAAFVADDEADDDDGAGDAFSFMRACFVI